MLSYPDFREKQVVVFFADANQKISFMNDNLVIRDEQEQILLQHSCYRIFAVWIIGHASITSGLLQRSKRFGFSICMLNHKLRNYGTWNAATEGNFLLRSKQYRTPSLEIARAIVFNKICNQREQLATIRTKSLYQKRTIKMLDEYLDTLHSKQSIAELMGAEGMASKVYFEAWFAPTQWQGRQPRAKRDITNVLLDMDYTFLFNIVESMLNLYGFDVYKGVLHQTFYQRKSLVCDIVEPFRVLIDKQVLKSYGLGQIRAQDFVVRHGQYTLSYAAAKPYVEIFISCLLARKQDIFRYVQSYYRWLMQDKDMIDFPVFEIRKP
jgi:CRISPR-associated protein Cas1